MKAGLIALLGGACALVHSVSAADNPQYSEKVLYSFCSQQNCTDGAKTRAGLIVVNGVLYGTTNEGGDNTGCGDSTGCGTVFSIDPGTDNETVLYSFCSEKKCADGTNPNAGLVALNGLLYGTSSMGGKKHCGCGTAFSLDPSSGAEKLLYTFCSQKKCADGAGPDAGLIDVNGTLYGTTDEGGAHGYGTVFTINPNTGAEKVLYSFKGGADGASPLLSGLIDVNGTLYGTTFAGGGDGCGNSTGCGTVFSINPNNGTEKVLHAFCKQRNCCIGRNCTDGYFPATGVIDVNGRLYGTTTYGGDPGAGTAFALDPNTGAEQLLYSFCSQHCADGDDPLGGLTAANGMLYGTTLYGGGSSGCSGFGCGTVFALNPDTGTEQVLYSFADGSDGAEPEAALIDVNGVLYGTTLSGGGTGCDGGGCGTVFALATDQ